MSIPRTSESRWIDPPRLVLVKKYALIGLISQRLRPKSDPTPFLRRSTGRIGINRVEDQIRKYVAHPSLRHPDSKIGTLVLALNLFRVELTLCIRASSQKEFPNTCH